VKRDAIGARAIWSRLAGWLPSSIDRRVRVIAWASLVIQTVLIGTGGAVRLTGSGLGCPTWPQCVPGSLTNTPEMGIHGVIEFTNRALTGVVVIIAILAFLAVIRFRAERRDLFVLTLLQGLSIPLQAVIGGITVLTGLNSYIVGLHFVVSLVLVVVTAMLVFRVYYGRRGTRRPLPRWYVALAHLASFFVAATVVMGILTTGSGPHAGDIDTPRNGLDTNLLQHLHSWPAYATLGATVLLVFGAWTLAGSTRLLRRFTLGLFAIELVQIVVGISQARLGLPELLVGIHMVLAATLVAGITAVVLSLRTTPADAVASGASPAAATPVRV
jgi:cytochrome c oxidase assembly protein subunit 15